jgi:carbamate kinase
VLVVAALGGNALLRRGEPMTAEVQRANAAQAALALAGLVRAGHDLVVTHGNGPQVGLLALQGAAFRPDAPDPLDMLGAETEGMIGYLIEQELENALGHDRPVATLLTQIVVDPADPAFARPTKPVGPVYAEAEAKTLAAQRGWAIAPDGPHWRRVVPSPRPVEIPDLRVIRLLLAQGVVVICAGGGGIPVVRRADGSLTGVEAVIDKDHASALLARGIGADALLMLTDVEGVMEGFGTPGARRIARLTVDQAQQMALPAGSMGPKVAAGQGFVAGGGKLAGIGRMEDAAAILDGMAGTVISA